MVKESTSKNQTENSPESLGVPELIENLNKIQSYIEAYVSETNKKDDKLCEAIFLMESSLKHVINSLTKIKEGSQQNDKLLLEKINTNNKNQEKINKETDSHIKNLDNAVHTIQDRLNVLEPTLKPETLFEETREQIKQFQGKLDVIYERLDRNESNFTEANEKIKELEVRTDKTDNRLNTQEANIKEVKEETKHFKENLDKNNEHISSLETDIKELKTKVDLLLKDSVQKEDRISNLEGFAKEEEMPHPSSATEEDNGGGRTIEEMVKPTPALDAAKPLPTDLNILPSLDDEPVEGKTIEKVKEIVESTADTTTDSSAPSKATTTSEDEEINEHDTDDKEPGELTTPASTVNTEDHRRDIKVTGSSDDTPGTKTISKSNSEKATQASTILNGGPLPGVTVLAANDGKTLQEEEPSKNKKYHTLIKSLDQIFIQAHIYQKKYILHFREDNLHLNLSNVTHSLINHITDELVNNQKLLVEFNFTKEDDKISFKLDGSDAYINFIEKDGQFSIEKSEDFTGVVSIQRKDKEGKFIKGSFDILRYQNGELIDLVLSAPPPSKENSRIFDLAKDFFAKENVKDISSDMNIYTRESSLEMTNKIKEFIEATKSVKQEESQKEEPEQVSQVKKLEKSKSQGQSQTISPH
ncbi:MAG: hypothetical protein ACK4OM_06665 [Alphaproteobacteria bacterium]